MEELDCESSAPISVDSDELLEILDAEVAERHDTVVVCPIDPDQAIFGFHFGGYGAEPVFILSELGSEARDSEDVRDLVELHAQAAAAAMC